MALKSILIDNYDSFTYNLLQYLRQINIDVEVCRNDQGHPHGLLDTEPDFIVLSPGPSRPDEAGFCTELVKLAAQRGVAVLGICLGHQCIGQAFGASIVRHEPAHGKLAKISHHSMASLSHLPNPFEAARYHSLVLDRQTLPECFDVTAECDGLVMGISHKDHIMEGLQFHPESILTPLGLDILRAFVGRVLS